MRDRERRARASACSGDGRRPRSFRLGGNARSASRAQRAALAELGDAREIDVDVWRQLRDDRADRRDRRSTVAIFRRRSSARGRGDARRRRCRARSCMRRRRAASCAASFRASDADVECAAASVRRADDDDAHRRTVAGRAVAVASRAPTADASRAASNERSIPVERAQSRNSRRASREHAGRRAAASARCPAVRSPRRRRASTRACTAASACRPVRRISRSRTRTTARAGASCSCARCSRARSTPENDSVETHIGAVPRLPRVRDRVSVGRAVRPAARGDARDARASIGRFRSIARVILSVFERPWLLRAGDARRTHHARDWESRGCSSRLPGRLGFAMAMLASTQRDRASARATNAVDAASAERSRCSPAA